MSTVNRTPHADHVPRPGTRRAPLRARHSGRTRTTGLTWADLGLSPDDLAWHDRAACREADPDAFFPNDRGYLPHLATARRVCRTCPVLRQCRAYALARPDLIGIWGGLTAAERARLHRAQRPTDQEAA